MPLVSRTFNFSAGTTIVASQVNTNETTLYNLVNGSLTNENLSAAAALDPLKVDNLASQSTTTDPYPGGVATAATDLTLELRQLRFQLDQIIGKTNWYEDPHTSLAGLPASQNLLRNAGFEGQPGTASLPDGWTAVGTATYSLDTTDDAEGDGRELTITSSAGAGVQEGISQALVGLKASTTYAISGSAKYSAGTGDGVIVTSGADTEATLTWTSADVTYVKRTGTFVTDATGTTVTVTVGPEETGVYSFDNLSVVELGNQQILASPGRATAYLQLTTAGTVITNAAELIVDDTGNVDLMRDVYVPGPGYYIKVRAKVGATVTTLQRTQTWKLYENNSAPATPTTGTVVDRTRTHNAINSGPVCAVLEFIRENPTPGQHYYYHVTGINSAADNITPQSGGNEYSDLLVEVIPYG